MKSFFRELFEYSHHFNTKLADVFVSNPDKVGENALKLFNHLINAHQIWNSRIEAKPQPVKVWDMRDTASLQNIDQLNYRDTLRILEEQDLGKMVRYINSQGQSFGNTVRDILFHVVNHSTYHRAQIATAFKQSGMQPLTTDYIFYKR